HHRARLGCAAVEQLRAAAAAGSARPGCAPQREKLLLRLLFLLWPPRGPFLRRPPPGGHGRARRQIPTAVSSSSRELRRDASSAGELLPAFRRGAASSPRTGRSRPLPEPSSNGGGGLRDDCEASRGGRLRPLRPFPFPPPHTSFISSPPPPSPISHHHPRRGGRCGGGGSYGGAPPRAADLFPRDCGRSVFHKCVMVPSKMKHSIHSTVEVSAQVPTAG
ncbi:unnamed protein product, partial [Urochloa humidicola]